MNLTSNRKMMGRGGFRGASRMSAHIENREDWENGRPVKCDGAIEFDGWWDHRVAGVEGRALFASILPIQSTN
jgi:hypothetical protein